MTLEEQARNLAELMHPDGGPMASEVEYCLDALRAVEQQGIERCIKELGPMSCSCKQFLRALAQGPVTRSALDIVADVTFTDMGDLTPLQAAETARQIIAGALEANQQSRKCKFCGLELDDGWPYPNCAECEPNRGSASQPKPQSDEGLREALVKARKMVEAWAQTAAHWSGGPHPSDDLLKDLKEIDTALSRQAPVPTSGAVEVARLVEGVSAADGKWIEKAVAIIQQAMDGAKPSLSDLKAEGVAFAKITYVGMGCDSTKAIEPLDLIRAMEGATYPAPYTSALTQPPAADGKLK